MNLAKEINDFLDRFNLTENDIEYTVIIYEQDFDNEIELYRGVGIDFSKLNIDYDNGYGSQEIFGYILFKNGAWLEREEYDGSEWWAYKECPKIEELKLFMKKENND